MRSLDQDIDAALRAEERDLLRQIEQEPGHIDQLVAVIGGRSGWVSIVLLIAQSLLFVAGVWAAWNFFHATDSLSALRFGLPASVLLIMALMIKLAMWPTLHAYRMLQALKRIELMLVRTRDGASDE
ncbi:MULTISPECIES: DUF6768 family protein [Brevundimonas]|jgi:hypothetical protein|uniref:DUF6768 family protein n=1 Tax=Brevundimonas TaxID=41275 RepID=UPI0019050ED3|nr:MULTISPECIES: DUF6768 family protein [Brevundimonas]MBK1970069.1 hypothetical protein [Brevundimonas diminuta]